MLRVLAEYADLFFGDVSWTGTAPAPVTRKVAYRNNSRTTQHLDLTVRATSPGGVKPATHNAGRVKRTSRPLFGAKQRSPRKAAVYARRRG